MSSTDFDTPPVKLIMLAVSLVVGLHVLTAVALVAIKPPAPNIELPKVTPPIEIQLLPPPPIEIEEVVIKEMEKAEPIEEAKVLPKATPVAIPKPATTSKLKSVKPIKPDSTRGPIQKPVTANTVQQSTIAQKMAIDHAADKKPVVTQRRVQKTQAVANAADSQTASEQQRGIVAAQTESAEQDARAKVEQAAKVAREATLAAQNAQKLAVENAERQAQAVKDAAEQAARDKAKQQRTVAVNNTPVNFTASNADWATTPNFSFPSRAERGTKSGDVFSVVLVLRVNKQGGIDSMRVAQPSGNAILDKEAQRQVRSGKFKPFNKDGVPVIGNVTLPISYRVP